MAMGMGGGGGGFMAGPSSAQANASAGLPHAGVPGHLRDQIEKVTSHEPDHPEPAVVFRHHEKHGGDTVDRFTLRRFLRPHAVGLLGALLLVALEAGLVNLGPVLTRIAIDDGIAQQDRSVLVRTALIFVASVVVAALVGYLRTAYTGRLGERLMYDLRLRVFAHFQRQSLAFFTSEKSGVLMTRMTSDIEALSVLFQEGLVQFAVQAMTLVAIVAWMALYFDAGLTIILLILAVPITVFNALIFRRAAAKGYLLVRDRIANILADLAESLAGIRIIAAHNRRAHNVINHRNVVGEHKDANLYMARAQSLYSSGSEGLAIIIQALVVLIGGRMVLRGELSIGELTGFVLFLNRFFAPIQTLIQLFNQYQQGSAAVQKLADLLARPPEVPEAPDATALPAIDGEIELRGVTFGYDPADPVLRDLNLRIEPGEVLSIVGPTGAGKSTVAKLISRFYDPSEGQVLIDGVDLRTVTFESLRRQLGVVPQEPFLFNGTIGSNVHFARPDATEAEITEAVEAVGLGPVIDALPNGLDTPVQERGASLSAGERQLLALARAFLARPRVLILDEATSNLDLASESTIERALDVVLEGRTAVIIAHRLATAMRADRIAIIDEGRLIEFGTHDELVALGGHYSTMHEAWMAHVGNSS
ncbi:MAG: ABC transporter ATP-binding protein [Acidimicrobiales bacterium]|nr:ABC transporter ATP-binding protein [Acidimicrobiales bacterium]